MTYEIIKGDARSLPMADASVDLIVTSPPYWSLRSYVDGGEQYDGQIGAESTPAAYIDNLIGCTREWIRVLKASGSLWINLGDKYNSAASGQNGTGRTGLYGGKALPGARAAGRHDRMGGRGNASRSVPGKSLFGLPWRYAIRCIDDLGLTLRAEVIWSKLNGLPESVTDRVRRSHETWFHLTKSPRYFASLGAIRDEAANPLGKLPGSVREMASQPLRVPADLGVGHYASFPMAWPQWIIKGWSPEAGTVLDPFGGTGTTALVADVLGRHGVSVDLSADYCRVAEWRISDPKQRERAARR
jgi:DNA modification methylase